MNFINNLLDVIEEWSKDSIEDEWLFARFREEAVGRLSATDAFMAIDETIKLLTEQEDESLKLEILLTIIELARQSDTTEIPKNLLKLNDTIKSQFKGANKYAHEKLNELFRFYRL